MASQRVAARIPLTGSIDAEARIGVRQSRVHRLTGGRDRVEVLTYDTERAEVERVADLLGGHTSRTACRGRRWRCWCGRDAPRSRCCDGGWPEPACPVEVASDETPLVREPAVRPLLDALRAVVNLDNDDPDDPDYLDPVAAEGLLVSPMVGLDATDVRTLSACPAGAGQAARPGGGPLAAALAVPPARGRARRRRLLDAEGSARSGGAAGSPALSALLRTGTRPARRFRHGRGGPLGAVVRHRLARAPAAGRVQRGGATATARQPRPRRDVRAVRDRRARRGAASATSVGEFLATLEAQEIPADTLADRGIRGESVRLLTAHRSKGLEWRLVVVAHVQEDRLARPASTRERCCRPTASAPSGTPRRCSSPTPPPASCSPRSAGCSTSPAPARASGWS